MKDHAGYYNITLELVEVVNGAQMPPKQFNLSLTIGKSIPPPTPPVVPPPVATAEPEPVNLPSG